MTCYRTHRSGALASALDVQSLFFLITETRICAMNRHHADRNINVLLTRNHPFDSDVRKWSQLLMIPLHCLWAISNKRQHGQFKCDVNLFCFCLDFVRSHVHCDFCSIVCLRFQIALMKQIDLKMSTKNIGNIIIFGQLHTQKFNVKKKKIVRLKLNEKKWSDMINECILQTKADMKEGLGNT